MSSQGAPSGDDNNGSKSSNEKSDDSKEQKQDDAPKETTYNLNDLMKTVKIDPKDIAQMNEMISKVKLPYSRPSGRGGPRGGFRGNPRVNSNGPSTSESKN